MTDMLDEFRRFYNTVRPHEAPAGDRPIDPDHAPPTALNAPVQTRQDLRIP